jgi:hypothetical protein
MPTFVVIAENYIKPGGEMVARWIGTVEADSLEQARRLAEAKWPRWTLLVREAADSPPPPDHV